MPVSVGRHVRLDTVRRSLAGRAGEVPHRFQEDLLQRVSTVRQLSHQQVLPAREAPDRVYGHPRGQYDPPAAEPFGNTLGADLRQRRAQLAIVARDLELDEGAIRPPFLLEVAVVDDRAVLSFKERDQ